jgi:hypothetical protein
MNEMVFQKQHNLFLQKASSRVFLLLDIAALLTSFALVSKPIFASVPAACLPKNANSPLSEIEQLNQAISQQPGKTEAPVSKSEKQTVSHEIDFDALYQAFREGEAPNFKDYQPETEKKLYEFLEQSFKGLPEDGPLNAPSLTQAVNVILYHYESWQNNISKESLKEISSPAVSMDPLLKKALHVEDGQSIREVLKHLLEEALQHPEKAMATYQSIFSIGQILDHYHKSLHLWFEPKSEIDNGRLQNYRSTKVFDPKLKPGEGLPLLEQLGQLQAFSEKFGIDYSEISNLILGVSGKVKLDDLGIQDILASISKLENPDWLMADADFRKDLKVLDGLNFQQWISATESLAEKTQNPEEQV